MSMHQMKVMEEEIGKATASAARTIVVNAIK